MGAEGSGRRRIKPPRKGFALTPPDGTRRGWERQLSEIQQGICAGDVDPRTADSLIAAAKAGILLHSHEEEWAYNRERRAMIEEVRRLLEKASAREAADRTHADGE